MDTFRACANKSCCKINMNIYTLSTQLPWCTAGHSEDLVACLAASQLPDTLDQPEDADEDTEHDQEDQEETQEEYQSSIFIVLPFICSINFVLSYIPFYAGKLVAGYVPQPHHHHGHDAGGVPYAPGVFWLLESFQIFHLLSKIKTAGLALCWRLLISHTSIYYQMGITVFSLYHSYTNIGMEDQLYISVYLHVEN